MSNKKEAIIEAFIQLLDENPTKRITVNDIVTRCGISRNTFYYYFPDIPALVDTIETRWMERVRAQASPRSLMDCVAPLVEEASAHRNGLLHVYHTVSRERFQNDLDRLWFAIVREYMSRADYETGAEDRELLTRYFKCMYVGVTLDWLEADMSYDLMEAGRRVCQLLTKQA